MEKQGKICNLNQEEVDVITHIMSRTKMDCWFYLSYSKSRGWVVIDLENNDKVLSLKNALQQARDGLLDLDLLPNISAKEVDILNGVLVDLGIDPVPNNKQ